MARVTHLLYPKILVCFLLCAHTSGGGAGSRTLTSSQGSETVQPNISMLDEGKGLIHLDVSVTRKDGHTVSDLDRQDFELRDEDRPEEILSFRAFDRQSVRPIPAVEIVLFVDTFKMLHEQAAQVDLSIQRFLHQNGGHLAQPLSIFGFSDDGLWTIAHHNSADGDLLASDLNSNHRTLLGRRADALHALAFVAAGQRRRLGRKVLIWIGPGCGRGSGIPPPPGNRNIYYWFSTLLREARLSIDEISVGQNAPCEPINKNVLYKKALAIRSGGSIENESYDLVAELNRCVHRADSFYTISFNPPAARGPHEYHRLEVRVDKPDIQAQTIAGYYDEPFYSDQPDPALRRLTVDQLRVLLSQGGMRDSTDWAEKLADVELTERLDPLNAENFPEQTGESRNREVQQALVRIADASSFLPPPAAEILQQAAPEPAARKQMLALTREYLEKSIAKLPNFFATRTTTRYQDEVRLNDEWTHVDHRPLHIVEADKAHVFFRGGEEVVESKNKAREGKSNQLLVTHGTFGPMLADLRRPLETPGRMNWVRWEKGPDRTRAVFEFEVSAAESRYFEGGCCLPDEDGKNSFRIQAGYRGEIAIDPASGTIRRLQLQFDLHEFVPQDLDEIEVDYGPVRVGGKTYFCPIRSVSIARGRSIVSLKGWDERFMTYGPYSTKMNEMRFSNYHVFRSESRILPGFNPEQ